ncbi:MAG: Rpn family recombination-promoting nuclease/putative transposase [Bacteroidetes bacterium]|nr:MAG: Rpn family recombination-promoting nuclease/putative transposase [Bacteroidota bacterium]
MIGRYINPKTDYAFKKIFGSAQSKDVLISFLDALIYEGNPTIEDLEIINPNLPPQLQGLKDTYLDVKARLNDGTIVIIEMQVLNVESFGKRVLYNAAKTYAFQLNAEEGYRMLKPIVALTITDFAMFSGFEKVISRFIFKEKETNLEYAESEMELIFVELPKFTKEIDELETLTDKWIDFMKSAPSLGSVPANMDEIPAIHKAFEIANRTNLTREELEALERREMFIYDQQGAIALGQREARQEEKRAIARQLLPLLDDEAIAQATGLSPNEIRNLRQE